MIYGIGTDIVEIVRIKDAVEKWGDHFLKKIYTDNEILYCKSKKDPYPHLAARFAAKEAFIKAASGRRQEERPFRYTLSDIEVLNNKSGKPFINPQHLNNAIPDLSFNIHLSISHERKYAVATVVIEVSSKPC